MGLLVGLPLKLFYMLFVLLRFVWPLVLVLAIRWLLKRLKTGAAAPRRRNVRAEEPDFDGPVYTVDYKIVEDEETEDKT